MEVIPADVVALIDECKAWKTETGFAVRWSLIEGYHKLGEIICASKYKNNTKILSRVTENTGIKIRNLYRAKQFYEMFPDLNKLSEGKDISWHEICNKYLPKPKDKEPEPELCTCPNCGREHRKQV